VGEIWILAKGWTIREAQVAASEIIRGLPVTLNSLKVVPEVRHDEYRALIGPFSVENPHA
jgi:hypothetical protein